MTKLNKEYFNGKLILLHQCTIYSGSRGKGRKRCDIMIKRLGEFVLFFTLFFILIISSHWQAEEPTNEPPSDIILTDEIRVNVVLVGLSHGENDARIIEENVTDWYVPWVLTKDAPIGVNFTIDLRIFNAPEEFTIDLSEYYNGSFYSPLKVGDYYNTTTYYLDYYFDVIFEEDDYMDIPVFNVDAMKIEDWLKLNTEKYAGLDNILDDYTLFMIMPEYVETGYYLSVNGSDIDTQTTLSANNLNAYGGNYNFFFIDYLAWPPNFGDRYGGDENSQADLLDYSPAWDYFANDDADIASTMALHINEAIEFLFLHSYLYWPTYELRYELDLIAFDCTSDNSFYDVAHQYINSDEIKAELKRLIPYANWTFELLRADIDDFPDINTIIEDESEIQGNIVIIDSKKLLPVCDDLIIFPEGYVTIPCFIFIFDDVGYVDSMYRMGGAESMDGINPWGIFMADGLDQMDRTGLSNTIIHEIGHVIGLMHPHHNVAVTEFGLSFNNKWFWDFSSTIMGYYEDMSNSNFNTFDEDVLNRGHCLDLMHTTLWNWYLINMTLLDKGYEWEVVPNDIRSNISSIRENLTNSIIEFKEENYFVYQWGVWDSWSYAMYAWDTSNNTYHDVENLMDYVPPKEFRIDLMSPANGSMDIPFTQILRWNISYVPNDNMTYTLAIGPSETELNTHIPSIPTQEYDLGNSMISIGYNITYYWQIQTKIDDISYISEAWSFTTLLSPGSPKPIEFSIIVDFPKNNSIVSDAITIQGTANVTVGDIEFVEISINGGDWLRTIGKGNWKFGWNTLHNSNGKYIFTIRCSNGIEYSEEVIWILNVDNG